MKKPSWDYPAPTIVYIRRRAGQFGCSAYIEQLLREPGAKLGTVLARLNRCVALLREAEDVGGTYTGQAIRFCFTRMTLKKNEPPMQAFKLIDRILKEAHARPEAVEESLEWAICAQRLTDPALIVRLMRAALSAPRYGRVTAETIRSVLSTPHERREDLFRLLATVHASRARAAAPRMKIEIIPVAARRIRRVA